MKLTVTTEHTDEARISGLVEYIAAQIDAGFTSGHPDGQSYWELEAQEPSAEPDRPRTHCGCGVEIVWITGEWQHDAAPAVWGDDHDIDEEEPSADDPARRYWDLEDGVIDEEETEEIRAGNLGDSEEYREIGGLDDDWRLISQLSYHGDTVLVTYTSDGEEYETTHDSDEVVERKKVS